MKHILTFVALSLFFLCSSTKADEAQLAIVQTTDPISPVAKRADELALCAVTFAADGTVLMLDQTAQRILAYSPESGVAGEAGGFGFDDQSLRGCRDIAAVGFELWVPDPVAGRIVRFDRRLSALIPLGNSLDDDASVTFERPVSVTQLPNGDLMLLEEDRKELVLLDHTGRFLERLRLRETISASLQSPSRLEAGPDGNVALIAPETSTLVLFDAYGTLKRNYYPEYDSPLVGIAWSERKLLAATEHGLYIMKPKQKLRIGVEALTALDKPIRDIAVSGKTLALITSKHLYFFEIREVRP